MSSIQDSTMDFPRLRGPSNFEIWKTRVQAALDGKGLLGFITKEGFQGDDSDSEADFDVEYLLDDTLADYSDLDELKPPESETTSSSSEDGKPTGEGNRSGDGDVEMPDASTSEVRPSSKTGAFKAKDARRQKKKLKKIREQERKAKAFLLKTIDDTHILVIKDMKTPFEIFRTLCEKYEGSAVYSDSYYHQHRLMSMRYETGMDTTVFFLELEKAMRDCCESSDSTMSDHQRSIYLFHAMPDSWKDDLKIWKGVRKYIPYAELRQHIEAKVRDLAVLSRYAIERVPRERTHKK